jgi:hypothetical protein
MSNFRSIGVVTATLERLLQSAANTAVLQTDVRIGVPTAKLAEDNKPVINLCLFRALPSAAHRNDFLPTRSGTGDMQTRTRLALDLHYVLSFYGDAAKFEPERLFGAASLALEDGPRLTLAAIEAAIADNANQAALKDSDLPADKPVIRVEAENHTFEELSKLWSVFYQVPYALSAFYAVRHIVIETQDELGTATPVTSPAVFVAPMGPLAITSAGAEPGKTGPVNWGGTLHLSGSGIARIGNGLRIDGVDLPLVAEAIVGDGIALTLDAALFGGTAPKSGQHQLQVIAAPTSPAQPERLRRGSNLVGFTILPVVTLAANPVVLSSGNAALRAGTLTVTVAPPLQAGQSVAALLNSMDVANPAQISFAAEEPANFPANQLKFKFAGLKRAVYLLRLDIGGVATAPTVGADPLQADFGRITGPKVDLS